MAAEHIYSCLKEGIIVFNDNLDILYCNDSVKSHLNEEIKGKSLYDMLSYEDLKLLKKSKVNDQVLLHFKEKDDQNMICECCIATDCYEEIAARVLVINEYKIMELPEKEALLWESMNKKTENVSDAVWIEDDDQHFIFINQVAALLFGTLAGKQYTSRQICQLPAGEIWKEIGMFKSWKKENDILQKQGVVRGSHHFEYMGEKYIFYYSKWTISNGKDEINKTLAAAQIRIAGEQLKEIEDSAVKGHDFVHIKGYSNSYFFLKLVKTLINAEGIYVYTYNEMTDRVELIKASKIRGGKEADKFFDLSKDVYEQFLCNRGEITIDEFIERTHSAMGRDWKKQGIRYVFKSPIYYGSECLGFFLLANKEGEADEYKYWLIIQEFSARYGLVLKNDKLSRQIDKELVRRKRVEEDLRNYLSIATDIIFITNEAGEITSIDQKCVSILGWGLEEVINQPLTQFIVHSQRDKVKKVFREAKESGEIKKGAQLCKTKDGKEKWVEWCIKFVPEHHIYYIVVRDITAERKKEKERRQYKEALQMETLKNEFIANMSHELKTPLNIIYSMLQLVEKELGDFEKNCLGRVDIDKLRQYRKVSKQNIYRLWKLINNIMDVTQIDAGSYKVHLVSCNIVSVIEEITMSVVEYVKNKQLEIIFDTEVEELVMACDIDKLERIMLNLLSNAIKYTPEGGRIMVNLIVQGKEVVIEVKDTGIGIPLDKQKMIFNRFTQVDTLYTRRCEGSGIGLALVKSFAELLKGRVEVESELGKGSAFRVRLPIIQTEDKRVEAYASDEDKLLKCNIEFSDIYNI